MRKVDYPMLIKEDIKELKQIERKLKYVYPRKITQLLILLKSGKCNLKEAAQLLSISYRAAKKYWQFYRENGVEGIISWRDTRRKRDKISDEELKEIVEQHQPKTLREMSLIIKNKKGVKYSISGLHSKCKRLKIKLKTGRPVHIKKNQKKQKRLSVA